MKLLKQGAEAKLFISEYLGKKCMVKVREHKSYREKSLDERILKGRMRSEAALLSRAKKAGIRTPVIQKIDTGNFSITCEFIEGKTLREELQEGSRNAKARCKSLGALVAKLHSNGIIHGDLTTSNIIVHRGRLVCLDFVLGDFSAKPEDKAVDLLCLKKMFLSTHFAFLECWKDVEQGYCRNYAGGKRVIGQMAAVESRARDY